MLINTKLDKTWIMAHIPHQGTMCLLDHITDWNTQLVRCNANSHRHSNNPLRLNGRLNMACGIEYAAQAMAVHSALLSYADNASNSPDIPRSGFLVSVRGAKLHKTRLDNIEADLDVEATCIHSGGGNTLYQFTLHAAGELLLDGRAAVMFNADTQLGISP